MSWARYDDELSMNKKIGRLRAKGVDGIAAVGLHLLANTYCRHNGTAGEIEAHVPELLAGRCGPKLARLLAEVGMFDVTEDGWEIHDFHDYSDPSDPYANRSAADRKRDLHEKRVKAGQQGGKQKASNALASAKQTSSSARANAKQTSSPVPVPTTKPLALAPQPRENPIWDSLTSHFGAPTTSAEKSNRGRQVKELQSAGATPDDIDARVGEHKRRHLTWTLTANALVTHWTELGAPKAAADDRVWDADSGAWLSRGAMR